MKRREGIEFWKRHLEAWRGSGLTQEVYCRQQGVSFTTFARYRNRINRERKDGGVPPAKFVPVAIKTTQPVVAPTMDKPAARASGGGHIEIRLANGRTIVVMDER